MGLFGVSRSEVNRIVDREVECVKRNLAEERKRICQIVSVLLGIIPEKVLNRKVSRSDLPYGVEVLPWSWFCAAEDYKLSIRKILEKIDP